MKLLEFRHDIREVVEKEAGGVRASGSRVQPRVVSVVTDKEGFLAPVVRGVRGRESMSMVTWSSIAAKLNNETAEEGMFVGCRKGMKEG